MVFPYESRFAPIIYVRGYAGSQSDVEGAVADPYMGFNVGSSKIRLRWDGGCQRHFFESPLVRLMKDFGYRDVFDAGDEMPENLAIDDRSIFIFRYYEPTSTDLGNGRRLTIEQAAAELGKRILEIRDRFARRPSTHAGAFRVYLVAHSMGGLICRSLIQNLRLTHPADGSSLEAARSAINKIFTYATPHNGIDFNLIGNLPGIWHRNDADNFNRDRMREFLSLPGTATGRVDNLNGAFDPDRLFNLVGTNDRDFDTGDGLVRQIVGGMSDGLVRIANATTRGRRPGEAGGQVVDSPRAFVYRSHSGQYGVLNSEEGFQNLTRFLFGDVRVDAMLRIEKLTLPAAVEKAKAEGKTIRASYQFEVVLRTRGATWDLHRRTAAENTAIFRKFDELFPPAGETPNHPTLFSAFLATGAKVSPGRPGLGFSVDLGILVPHYEIDRRLWFDDHYEGGYLFREKINFEAVPPGDREDDDQWSVLFGFDSESPNRATRMAGRSPDAAGATFTIPIEQKSKPGIEAVLELTARHWQ